MLLYQVRFETQEILRCSLTQEKITTLPKQNWTNTSPDNLKNFTYKIFQFRQATQQAGESVEQFATRLRKLAANCDFHDVNKEITSVIVPQLSFKMHTTVCPLRKQVNT